jgi:hypothetical protein
MLSFDGLAFKRGSRESLPRFLNCVWYGNALHEANFGLAAADSRHRLHFKPQPVDRTAALKGLGK